MTLYDVPVVLSLAPMVDPAKSVEMQCAIVNKDDFSLSLDLTLVINIIDLFAQYSEVLWKFLKV